MSTEKAAFERSLRLGTTPTTVLSASPSQWAAWMDVVSPVAFKALVLLAEPLDDLRSFANSNEWAVVALVERGMHYWDAEAGVAELVEKGCLPSPTTLKEIAARSTPPSPSLTPRARPERRCAVCGGTSRIPAPGAMTYVVKRGRFVKIGVTTNWARRRAQLEARDIGVIVPAGFNHRARLHVIGHTTVREHDLHEHLAEHYEAGEWFRDSHEFRAALHEAADLA